MQKQQAVRYARRLGLSGSTLALFVPTDDEADEQRRTRQSR